MLHLSSERLAALADSEPAPHEADHLAGCAACARERAANRSLLMMARAEREQLGMPLTRWDSLAPELHRAGLVAAGALMSAAAESATPAAEPSVRSTMRRAALWLQAAAVLFLVGGGAVLGRFTAGADPIPVGLFSGREEAPAAAEVRISPRVADHVDAAALLPEFTSVDEALFALRRYEVAYQHAATYLADHDSTTRVDDSEAYRTRLAALDRAGRAMSDALREVPYDPVINGYYLTTLGQRQATLRQLEMSLPDGHRIRSF
jgi:hypothetical protein